MIKSCCIQEFKSLDEAREYNKFLENDEGRFVYVRDILMAAVVSKVFRDGTARIALLAGKSYNRF
jgi:hypothetical protein